MRSQFRLIRPFHWHAKIVGVFLGEFGELHADFFQVQAGDFPRSESDDRIPALLPKTLPGQFQVFRF
jgi:hypothetical protein